MGDDSTARKMVSHRFQFGLRSLTLCIAASAVICAGIAAWSRAVATKREHPAQRCRPVERDEA